MGRRFPDTPPPRPSGGRSTSGSSTPSPAPTTPRGGYSDQGLPTNNQITFSSSRTEPTKAARQARMVGDLARNQQADAQQDEQQSGEQNESYQPSVLDAANMNQRLPSGSMYDEAPEDADGPADDYKQKNERFREEQALAAQRGKQFNSSDASGTQNSDSAEEQNSQEPGQNPNRPKASTAQLAKRTALLLKQQQELARIQDANERRKKEIALSDDAEKLGNDALHKVGVSKKQVEELGGRITTLLSAGSGLGLVWAAPKANITAANRYINSRILYFGYRSPKERAENPGTKYLDMIDVIIAATVNLVATIYLLPVIGMVAAIILVVAGIVLGASYLGPIIGELVTQLMF